MENEMALTADELNDLRADLGDQTSPYAFSDDELQRLHIRTGEAYTRTLLLAIKQLLMNATKFYNYTAGYTRQEQAIVFKNLKDMYELQSGEAIGGNQAAVVGIAIVPPAHKAEPNDETDERQLPNYYA